MEYMSDFELHRLCTKFKVCLDFIFFFVLMKTSLELACLVIFFLVAQALRPQRRQHHGLWQSSHFAVSDPGALREEGENTHIFAVHHDAGHFGIRHGVHWTKVPASGVSEMIRFVFAA
jgi:hypothetical protein